MRINNNLSKFYRIYSYGVRGAMNNTQFSFSLSCRVNAYRIWIKKTTKSNRKQYYTMKIIHNQFNIAHNSQKTSMV